MLKLSRIVQELFCSTDIDNKRHSTTCLTGRVYYGCHLPVLKQLFIPVLQLFAASKKMKIQRHNICSAQLLEMLHLFAMDIQAAARNLRQNPTRLEHASARGCRSRLGNAHSGVPRQTPSLCIAQYCDTKVSESEAVCCKVQTCTSSTCCKQQLPQQ